ncbi:MAG: beta-1,6-glucan synthase [Betaproteobacteria bacterium]|nr:MAG: beta-1,6-glucan synthase [Betaproteobacteria bacterium]
MPVFELAKRPLWIALLVVNLIALAGLLAWIHAQTRPVAMYDLHLSEGEKLKCVSYAPYHLPGQTPFDKEARVSREQIAADLAALSRITECVRLYSIDQGLDQVVGVARETGLKVLLGAWIGFDRKKNAIELERAITLANANPDVVRALIVGNEVLLRRERSEDEMRALIREAKSRTTVPVTYADVWEFWIKHDSLSSEVDFVTVHILPFWEDEPVDIEHALTHVADIHGRVSAHFSGKRLLIGETGWPSEGRQREESKPSHVNQARYIREFVHQAHAHGWDYNLIEALDQPWKRRLEGTVGGYWGMLEAQTLKPKFPLAGPVTERTSALGPLVGAGVGAFIALLLAATTRGTDWLRSVALASVGTTGGVATALHWEHAMVAYRDTLEWGVLGGVALLAALLPATLARWRGDTLPTAEQAWGRVQAHARVSIEDTLALLRGALMFAAAIAALLLFVDSRYRDFPTLLYLTPAVVFGVIGWWQGKGGRAERIFASVTLISAVGRWLPEPANPQAIGWLLAGLALSIPLLAARTGQHEQR